jgi:excinuclease ABC subunit B
LFERRDVIIVASVSCIYGIGSPETYSTMTITLKVGQNLDMAALLRRLVELQYKRNDANFYRGMFRVRGDSFELFPAHLEDRAWRFSMFGDEIEAIHEFDPLTGEKQAALDEVKIYANSHYVTPKPTLTQAGMQIKEDLKVRLKEFEASRQAAGSAAVGAAHQVRSRDDRRRPAPAPASRTTRAT